MMYGVGVKESGKQDVLFYHQYPCPMVFKPLFWSSGLETIIFLPLILVSKMKLLKGKQLDSKSQLA